ncbi:MAG: MBL fold metallo-hydrolase [Patescibacteria group bacterium]
MVVNYCGEGCFKVQTGGTSIVTDPLPRFKGDITLQTKFSISNFQFPSKEIVGEGEYEIKGIDITGWQLKESSAKEIKTIYSVKAEEMNLVFLGEISDNLEPTFLEKLGTVDILFLPAIGKPFISQEAAAKLIKQIGPKIVVGSHIKKPEDAKKFFQELDQKLDVQEKLVVKRKDLPAKMTALCLKA